jgi:hypothetical protein
MFTAAFFGSWFAYVAITFALGFIWHLVIFKDMYHRLAIYTRLDDPIIPRFGSIWHHTVCTWQQYQVHYNSVGRAVLRRNN